MEKKYYYLLLMCIFGSGIPLFVHHYSISATYLGESECLCVFVAPCTEKECCSTQTFCSIRFKKNVLFHASTQTEGEQFSVVNQYVGIWLLGQTFCNWSNPWAQTCGLGPIWHTTGQLGLLQNQFFSMCKAAVLALASLC